MREFGKRRELQVKADLHLSARGDPRRGYRIARRTLHAIRNAAHTTPPALKQIGEGDLQVLVEDNHLTPSPFFTGRSMPRFLAPLFLLCLTFNAHADSYITRLLNKPVPGGVAVVDLGAGAQAPKATYQGKPVLVVKEQNNWLAIVGVPLTVKPGAQQISSGGRTLPFTVGNKKYPEQRITLKNTQQVNPNPANLKRIEGELAEQIKAYRSFSPNTPSNLLLDKPVDGPLSSKFGVRRFFNGEERNPHAGLDFAVPAGTPIKTPAGAK